MTVADMRKFSRDALNVPRSEPGDIVYAGATAVELQRRADDLAAQATARGDTAGAAVWRGRSEMLARVQYVAPGATGILWRESSERAHFIVPNVGLVQSLEVDQIAESFSGLSGDDMFAAMSRGLPELLRIVEGWGWTAQGERQA